LTGLILFGACSVWAADFSPTYTGLHGGEEVFGVDASLESSPFVNADNYSILVRGDETESYANVRFNAYGLYAEGAVDLDNSGRIDMSASGGTTADGIFSAYAEMSVFAISGNQTVNNRGALTLTATGGTVDNTGIHAYANLGVYGIDTDGPVDNSGEIGINASGGDATATHYAYAYVDATGIESNGSSLINSGAITLRASGGTASGSADYGSADYGSALAHADAVGIESESSVGSLTNSGTIAVTAIGGTAEIIGDHDYSSAGAHAYAAGIYSQAEDETTTNSGDITVIATGGTTTSSRYSTASQARAKGINADGDVDNSGGIDVTATGGTAASSQSAALAYAYAYGIDSGATVINNGSISAAARGGISHGGISSEDGAAYADAWGIYAREGIVNRGDIRVDATGGTATADSAEPYALAVGLQSSGDIVNSGGITVNATYGNGTGTATADSAEPYALAVGLQSSGDIVNSGGITVNATYGNGTGTDPFSTELGDAHAGACGILSLGGSVNNSGHIVVSAAAPDALGTAAGGIFLVGGGSLTNTGVIQASGDRAYEVGIMSGSARLEGVYNMTLDGDPTIGSLYIHDGATLILNDATLQVASLPGVTAMDTEYLIFATEEGTGEVRGAFGDVLAANPDLAAVYHDQATPESFDDTVSLTYRPQSSPLLEAADFVRQAVTLSADLVGQRLVSGFMQSRLAASTPKRYAQARTVVSDAGPQAGMASAKGFFFTPYYASIEKDAEPAGYDADLVGFVTGLERRARGKLYGFHLGFGHAGLDFTGRGYNRNKEDQELFSGGVHLMGGRGNWTWRGQVTGFYGWHDYEGRTGAALEIPEKADYDSYGVRTTVMAGHTFSRGAQMLLPEVGVEYLWLHTESVITDAANSVWDMHGSSLDEHQASALASLRWLTRLQANEVEITPSLAAGMRLLLTDDELDAAQSVAGSAPVTVRSDQDEITGSLSASVRFQKEQMAAELAYGGEFGDDKTMHSAWLRFRYMF
jgi:hypothetical protein